MWNYTEMYSTSFWPAGSMVASLNQTLAEIHLSMINHWGEVQRDMIRRYTADVDSVGEVEQAGFVAAAADEASVPEEAAPEPDEQSPVDALPPDDSEAEEDDVEADESGEEVAAVSEPAPFNAAMAILNNPALAAEAATRGANDAVDYEVRDDVADDITAEIQREVRQELNPPSIRP